MLRNLAKCNATECYVVVLVWSFLCRYKMSDMQTHTHTNTDCPVVKVTQQTASHFICKIYLSWLARLQPGKTLTISQLSLWQNGIICVESELPVYVWSECWRCWGVVKQNMWDFKTMDGLVAFLLVTFRLYLIPFSVDLKAHFSLSLMPLLRP